MKVFTIIRILASILLLSQTILFYQVSTLDSNVSRFLRMKDQTVFPKIINGIPIYQPLSESIVVAYNANLFEKNCKNLNYYSNLLLSINSRSTYAYFMRAMCLEISGNLPQALEEIQKALITEPYNPDYLFAAAVINFNMKNYELTSMYLSEVRIIEPDLPRLSELEELLRNSLLQ